MRRSFRALPAARSSAAALMLACSSLLACSSPNESAPEAETVGTSEQAVSAGRVVAYIDGTVGTVSSSVVDVTKYTHINYAFANLDANGNVYFQYPSQDDANLNMIKSLKNSNNPAVKILISVGGWTWSNNFSVVAGDATKRANMVSSIWNMVNAKGVDGIDIDWEWPGWQGEGDNSVCAGTCDGGRLLTLMQAIWNARGTKLVTIAGGAHPNMGAYVDLAAVSNYVHFMNLMTYDFHGPWEPAYAPHANLYGGDISISSAVSMYINEGVPRSKIVVGIPFYGKAWGMSDPSPLYRNIVCSSGSEGASCTVNGAGGHVLHYDNTKKAAYIDGSGHYISYDNVTSVGWKTAYINNESLGGAMYWSAAGDTAGHTLTNKIWADIGSSGVSTYWTAWKNRDAPAGSGDYEDRSLMSDVCSNPIDFEARVVGTTTQYYDTDERLTASATGGLFCLNSDQTDGSCLNYEIRFLCPSQWPVAGTWTGWLDRDDPSGAADNEALENFSSVPCAVPWAIEAQTTSGASYTTTGDFVRIEPSYGLVCENSMQPDGTCADYRVRFFCPN